MSVCEGTLLPVLCMFIFDGSIQSSQNNAGGYNNRSYAMTLELCGCTIELNGRGCFHDRAPYS